MKPKSPQLPLKGALISPRALPLGLVTRLSNGRDPILANLPAAALVRPMLMSLSLSQEEKQRILDELPTLSVFQFEELKKVFADERREFKRTPREEFPEVAALQARAIQSALDLVKQQDDVSQPLLHAWARRILRYGARRGLVLWLNTLSSEWWKQNEDAQLYLLLNQGPTRCGL
jgi:hypothetical protein